MKKKNLYFVQVGFSFDRSLYFPYAVGAIAAYSFQNEWVINEFEVREFLFFRENLDAVLYRLQEPYLVAFSNYIWNFEYNKAFAKKLKTLYPRCIIVFGGHNVPEGNSLLSEEPEIDILIHGEGEEPFLELLKALPSLTLQSVPNISFRGECGELIETRKEACKNIERYPSPYLTGMFDKLIEENKKVDFLAVLETNRGCPFNCSYCDWCAGRTVRFFPMEKVKSEINWLAEHKIEYCFCADSNFGMFPRDTDIVNYLTETKSAKGYLKVFRPCYAKNSDDAVFRICQKLNTAGMDKGATLAYQTLCDDALININRKNLTLDRFSNLLSKYNEAGIPSYSELILGLPGETYESFCTGLCELLEAGQHNSVSVYYCELLVNSEMAQKEYIEKHCIQTVRVPFNHIHSAAGSGQNEILEYSTLVVGTATLSREMWVKANMFSVCVQSFHSLGLLRCFAIYLYYESKVKYLDFYNQLLKWIHTAEGTLVHTIFTEIEEKLKDTKTGNWNYYNDKFGEAVWFFEEGVFLETVTHYDRFWEEIIPFLGSFMFDEKIRSDLLKYQKSVIKCPNNKDINVELHYDFYEYFLHIYTGKYHQLEGRKNILHIKNESEILSLKDYARETVWYGRRRGATLHTNNKGEALIEYIPD